MGLVDIIAETMSLQRQKFGTNFAHKNYSVMTKKSCNSHDENLFKVIATKQNCYLIMVITNSIIKLLGSHNIVIKKVPATINKNYLKSDQMNKLGIITTIIRRTVAIQLAELEYSCTQA